MNISAEVKVFLKKDNRFLMGPGVYALLTEIKNCTSVSEAAQNLDISYSKAWKMIREAEEGAGEALVQRASGGKGGGKASLTQCAVNLLESYSKTVEEIQGLSCGVTEKIFN